MIRIDEKEIGRLQVSVACIFLAEREIDVLEPSQFFEVVHLRLAVQIVGDQAPGRARRSARVDTPVRVPNSVTCRQQEA